MVWFSSFSMLFVVVAVVMYRGKPQGQGIPGYKAVSLISLFICEDVDRDNHSDFDCMEYRCRSILPSCHCLLTKSTFHFSTLSSPHCKNAKLPSSLVHI